MTFDPLIAVTRFGAGPSPHHGLPGSAQALYDEAARGDVFAHDYPFMDTEELLARDEAFRVLRGELKALRNKPGEAEVRDAQRAAIAAGRAREQDDFRRLIVRHCGLEYGLGERLVTFWADHFAAAGRSGILQYGVGTMVNGAIRPHVLGRFSEMLKAVMRHPIMLLYLDQAQSAGPNSRTARNNPRRGLNENLAREVLELHTLGVGGPYTQDDVRQLAELFTGLSFQRSVGFTFRRFYAEPGAETVLGRSYGGRGQPDGLEAIDAALEDLAVHPTTAAHLALKLATHFVSDAPDPGLVRHMAARYLAGDGDLGALTAAMLEHPAAWSPERVNVKWPVCFITTSVRALGLTPDDVMALDQRTLQGSLRAPLLRMGQRWRRPPDPAGWSEEDEAWVTPQTVAIRVNWAMRAPSRLLAALSDPRKLVTLIAGRSAPAELAFAANAAERVAEGVGLVLASPTFQRR